MACPCDAEDELKYGAFIDGLTLPKEVEGEQITQCDITIKHQPELEITHVFIDGVHVGAVPFTEEDLDTGYLESLHHLVKLSLTYGVSYGNKMGVSGWTLQ